MQQGNTISLRANQKRPTNEGATFVLYYQLPMANEEERAQKRKLMKEIGTSWAEGRHGQVKLVEMANKVGGKDDPQAMAKAVQSVLSRQDHAHFDTLIVIDDEKSPRVHTLTPVSVRMFYGQFYLSMMRWSEERRRPLTVRMGYHLDGEVMPIQAPGYADEHPRKPRHLSLVK